MTALAPTSSIGRNRNFNIFWFGQATSHFGDACAAIAIPLLVLEITHSLAQMGGVTATFGVGWILATTFAGHLADRTDRRRMLIYCDVGRLLAFGAIPVAWLLHAPGIWLIYLAALAGSVLGMCFQVGLAAILPDLVSADHAVQANGRLAGSRAVAYAVGPVVAGLLVQSSGAVTAVAVDALTFLVSTGSLLLVRLDAERAPTSRPKDKGGIRSSLAGLQFIWARPILRAVTGLMICVAFLLVASNDLLIYLLKVNLHQSSARVGLLFGIASIGGVVGGFAAAAIKRRTGFAWCFLGGIAGEGLSFIALGTAHNVVLFVLFAISYGFAQSIRFVVMVAVRQQLTPNDVLGRVTSGFLLLASTSSAIGTLLITGIAARTNAAVVVVVVGIACVCVALVGATTAARIGSPELDPRDVRTPVAVG